MCASWNCKFVCPRLSADEVLELKAPWSSEKFEVPFSAKVINAVLNGDRPAFSANNALLAPPGYVKLMQTCWEEAANDRPDFSTVLYRLQDMHRDALASAMAAKNTYALDFLREQNTSGNVGATPNVNNSPIELVRMDRRIKQLPPAPRRAVPGAGAHTPDTPGTPGAGYLGWLNIPSPSLPAPWFASKRKMDARTLADCIRAGMGAREAEMTTRV